MEDRIISNNEISGDNFDNTIKSVDQVEKLLGVPVIGAVPVAGKKGN